MLNYLGGEKVHKIQQQQEEELLKKYEDKAKKGTITTVEEIKREYEEKVGHKRTNLQSAKKTQVEKNNSKKQTP